MAQSTTVIADITREIVAIDQQSNQAAESSNQVHLNAEGLADLAAQLETLMKKFKV
jgi:methyl-accepting chemotaxis protein